MDFIQAAQIVPILVFVGIVFGIWWLLTVLSKRNSSAVDRLERISRPADRRAAAGAVSQSRRWARSASRTSR